MDKKDTDLIKSILDYWYIPTTWDRHSSPSPEASKLHFSGGKQADDYIREHFSHVVDSIEKGQLEHWKKDHFGRLAYILACDQFTRNIFRESAKQYAFDHHAIALSDEIVANKEMYSKYKFFERQFIVLPYMHSESLQHQQKCIDLYGELEKEAEKEKLPDVASFFKSVIGFGHSHMEAIKKFGRYPSRNKVLGRESTPQELEYIQNGGYW